MNIKLILLDLDDTLLNSSQQVSAINTQALLRCKELGHHIGIITARSPRKVASFLQGLPCDCIAYYNGATQYAGDVMLAEHVIPYDVGNGIIREIKQRLPAARVGIYMEPYSFFDGELRVIATGERSQADVGSLPHCSMQRIRIVADLPEGFVGDLLHADDVSCFVSAHGSAVIVHKQATKENALRTFAVHFHIPLSDVIAFGDDHNDAGMLAAAGVGVAMGNAAEAVKTVADVVTGTNDQDGVAQWLEAHLI